MNRTLSTQFPACPTQLEREQIEQFQRDGFLAFTDVLTPEEVVKAKAALSELVLHVARHPDVNANPTFWGIAGNRLAVQFEPGYNPPPPSEADGAIELKVRKLMWFCNEHPDLGSLSEGHERIGGIMNSLVGENPIIFQDMALVKPPFIGSEKPWHQDNAYFSVTPLEAVVGVWIALDEATVANGCMHVLKGAHREGARRHHHDRDCEIVPERVEPERATPVELPPGGGMFFAGMLPHQTPPNASPDRRRALQFHYRSAQSSIISQEEYNLIFAEADGTPASCNAAR